MQYLRQMLVGTRISPSTHTTCCFPHCHNRVDFDVLVIYNRGRQHEKNSYLPMCEFHYENYTFVLVEI